MFILIVLLGFQRTIILQNETSFFKAILLLLAIIIVPIVPWVLGALLGDNAFLGELSTNIMIAIMVSSLIAVYARIMKNIVKKKHKQ